ncbi:XRE family transcriptional regulator [Cupriavidus sp. H19C3]|uniref:XRE family transcriptional regulator n=1 Tax=Cupriavidus sp. H19C3 TaxID=3241603 RepID=UPI003BF89D56
MDKALQNLIANLKSLIGPDSRFKSEAAMARATNVQQKSLNRLLKGEQVPSIELIEQIATGLGMPLVQLLSATRPDAGDTDFAMLPRLDVKASAGNGNLVFIETERGRLAFRRDFLRQEGVKEPDAVVIYADGNSMEPTIPDGAVLLVDLAKKEMVNNSIHVIRVEGEILVKRLRKEIGGGVLIVSDNPDKHRYPDISVPVDKEEYVTIIGKVFWMGARL